MAKVDEIWNAVQANREVTPFVQEYKVNYKHQENDELDESIRLKIVEYWYSHGLDKRFPSC